MGTNARSFRPTVVRTDNGLRCSLCNSGLCRQERSSEILRDISHLKYNTREIGRRYV